MKEIQSLWVDLLSTAKNYHDNLSIADEKEIERIDKEYKEKLILFIEYTFPINSEFNEIRRIGQTCFTAALDNNGGYGKAPTRVLSEYAINCAMMINEILEDKIKF